MYSVIKLLAWEISQTLNQESKNREEKNTLRPNEKEEKNIDSHFNIEALTTPKKRYQLYAEIYQRDEETTWIDAHKILRRKFLDNNIEKELVDKNIHPYPETFSGNYYKFISRN